MYVFPAATDTYRESLDCSIGTLLFSTDRTRWYFQRIKNPPLEVPVKEQTTSACLSCRPFPVTRDRSPRTDSFKTVAIRDINFKNNI